MLTNEMDKNVADATAISTEDKIAYYFLNKGESATQHCRNKFYDPKMHQAAPTRKWIINQVDGEGAAIIKYVHKHVADATDAVQTEDKMADSFLNNKESATQYGMNKLYDPKIWLMVRVLRLPRPWTHTLRTALVQFQQQTRWQILI